VTPMQQARRTYGVVMQDVTDLFERFGLPVTPDLADVVHDIVCGPHYDASEQSTLRAATELGLLPPTGESPLYRLVADLIAGDRTTVEEARLLSTWLIDTPRPV